MAKEDIGFTIFKGNCRMILSQLLFTETAVLSLVFPYHKQDSTSMMMLINRNAFSKAVTIKQTFFAADMTPLYLVNLADDTAKTLFARTQFGQDGTSLVRCSKSEMQLIKTIAKNLYLNYCSKEFSSRRLYFNIFLKCVEEFVARDKSFITRKESVSQQFLTVLYGMTYPEHTVNYYAGQLCVTRRYLTRAMGCYLGESPKIVIDKQIITVAKRLLENDVPMYIIADELKFESQSSFATFFKKHTKLTPTQYRTQILNRK